MSQTYDYQTPAEGTKDWHLPLNENFERIFAHLEVLNWRLMDLDGYDLHSTVAGKYDYETPSEGASNWHVPLNDNFNQIAAFVQDLDDRVSEKDGASPETYDYQTPAEGAKDWHVPLNDNFEQIAEDIASLDSRISTLEETNGSYVASIASGSWNDPAVWDTGSVPSTDDNVLIRPGHSITLAGGTADLDWIRLEGSLTFDPTVDTALSVDTLLTTHGSSLVIGTSENPIQNDVEARMTFRYTGPINENLDPKRRTRGLLVHGALDIHGSEKTPWTTLTSAPTAGDSSISLAQSPTNWQAGDRIVIPGVVPNDNQDEERTIESVSGSTVQLDSSLQYDHAPPKSDFDSHVLNLSRNVVFESESTQELRRGHVMIMMTTGTDVRYVQFDELGRTNKDQYLTAPARGADSLPDGLDPNPPARYPMHWHITGIDADEPHIAEGLVVNGAPGWGIVNHHAYGHIRDSITYDVLGSGFVAEGGNERGTFKRNFALRSKGSGDVVDSRAAGAHGGDPPIDDFGHAGHGFWFQSPLVEVTDNVAAGHRHHAFVWWLRPLLEGIMAEGSTVNDSRVSYVPNLPWEFCNTDRPLFDAIEEGRFGGEGWTSQDYIDTQKIPSTFAELATVAGNTAFASGGGADFSRHNFKWKHERFSDFNTLDEFTIYNIGEFIDSDGERHHPDLPIHRASGHQGRGGGVGVSFRYTSNVALKNSTVMGTGVADSVGIPFHDYLWTLLTENCTIENWYWGHDTGEHRLNWIRDCSFADNEWDFAWLIDNVGPAIVDNCDFDMAGYDFERRSQKASEVLLDAPPQTRGMRIDGRTLYYEEQAADYVMFPTTDDLDNINNIEDIPSIDDETALVGITNQEMLDQFGVTLMGSLIPDDAVTEPWIDGGVIDPMTRQDPPESLYLDATNADSLGGWNAVDDPDSSGGRAIESTGAGQSSPATFTFDCAAGTYTIQFRIRPSAWNGDDVDFRIDGGEWLTAEKLKSPIGPSWEEVGLNDDTAHTWSLTDGTHTLEMASDSDEVLVDEIVVVSNAEVVGAYGPV